MRSGSDARSTHARNLSRSNSAIALTVPVDCNRVRMNHVRGLAWTILVLTTTLLAVPRAARGGTDPERASETPTTAPGESPRAALRAYNAAMRAGDVDAIVALQHAANETEARVARVIAK